jgi:hypothetical protein
MATIISAAVRDRQFGAPAPYGNGAVVPFRLVTNANGSVAGSSSLAAVGIGDKIIIGSLPNGLRLDDFQAIVTTGMTAALTGTLGFEYEDGVDDPKVPQDAAYFGAGLALNAAGRIRCTTSKLPVTLNKAAFLVLVTAGAANAKASSVQFLVYGEYMGSR